MRRLAIVLSVLAVLAGACGSSETAEPAQNSSTGTDTEITEQDDSGEQFDGTLVIGAIPDQDPEILVRNYDLVADYLSDELDVEVQFEPVTEYAAAVTAFSVGDLDLVWFGGLSGVQARLQVEGAEAIAQRDIDEAFTSVFIAATESGIEPFTEVEGLSVIAGRSFTFGSKSSTSGRLMPQSFLNEAGVSLDDLDGEEGFSGSHDTTIEFIESGTFEVGALNSQVWDARVEAGEVDLDKVQVIFETPPYFDYHWVARPEVDSELQAQIVEALKNLDLEDPEQAEILEFFGAGSFIETESANYDTIEAIARENDLIDG